MKKIELYECGVCKTRYGYKADAIACEKSHIIPVEIIGTKYNGKNVGNQDGLPVKITVRFQDGKQAEYRR
jgi:hypothetical protein